MKDAVLTNPQKILLAAAKLGEKFHESDLTVYLWRHDPLTWGLKTREFDSADSNKVRTYLIGARGLIARGLFIKVGEYTYSLTDTGRKHVEALTRGEGVGESMFRPALSQPDQRKLVRLLDTRVFRCFASGMDSLINRGDLDLFWNGCGPEDIALLVERARACLVGSCMPLRGQRTVRARELDVLDQANGILVSRFKKQPALA